MAEKEMKQEGVNATVLIAQLEEELRQERARHLEDVKLLTEKIEELSRLYDKALNEIARLRSILDNNSGNSSLPPSTDQKNVIAHITVDKAGCRTSKINEGTV